MKTYLLVGVLLISCFFCSCRKDSPNHSPLNGTVWETVTVAKKYRVDPNKDPVPYKWRFEFYRDSLCNYILVPDTDLAGAPIKCFFGRYRLPNPEMAVSDWYLNINIEEGPFIFQGGFNDDFSNLTLEVEWPCNDYNDYLFKRVK